MSKSSRKILRAAQPSSNSGHCRHQCRPRPPPCRQPSGTDMCIRRVRKDNSLYGGTQSWPMTMMINRLPGARARHVRRNTKAMMEPRADAGHRLLQQRCRLRVHPAGHLTGTARALPRTFPARSRRRKKRSATAVRQNTLSSNLARAAIREAGRSSPDRSGPI